MEPSVGVSVGTVPQKKPATWGPIAVAVVFAVIIIGTAIGTYFFGQRGEDGGLAAGTVDDPNDADGDSLSSWEELVWHTDPANPDTDGDGVSDGDEVRARTDPAIAGKGADTFAEWGGSTPTEQFLENISMVENAYVSGAISEEALDVALQAASDSLGQPNLSENIPMSALTISSSTPRVDYANLLIFILQESTKAREYEPTVFKRAAQHRTYSGIPELKETALLYKRIEAALIVMEVPEDMATEHLSAVNAIGSLANVVNAMANWGGDPVAGISYLNAFFEVEAYVDEAVSALLAKAFDLPEKETTS